MNRAKLILVLRRVTIAATVCLGLCTSIRADSLWPEQGTSMFSDNRAYRVGDIVTVIVAEEARVSNSSGSSLSKSTDTQGEIETLDWPKGSGASKVFTGDKPKVKFGSKRSFDGQGSYQLAGTMETQLTAVVLDVLPNGNLVIEGSRLQQSVDETVIVRISGIVRPEDIRSDNTVPSTALAEGKIVFESHGPVARSSRRGFLNRLVDLIWPF